MKSRHSVHICIYNFITNMSWSLPRIYALVLFPSVQRQNITFMIFTLYILLPPNIITEMLIKLFSSGVQNIFRTSIHFEYYFKQNLRLFTPTLCNARGVFHNYMRYSQCKNSKTVWNWNLFMFYPWCNKKHNSRQDVKRYIWWYKELTYLGHPEATCFRFHRLITAFSDVRCYW